MSTAEAPEGVDPETGEITGPVRYPDHIRLNNEPMDEAEAKQITRRIKTYGVRMCQEIVRAYDGSAHLALGCKTWEDYCADHLGISRQRAHQVIEAARKTSNLALMVEVSPGLLVMPERWLRGVTNEELAEVASTAVDAIDPDATEDERAAAVVDQVEKLHRTTHRRSESTTHEFSSDRDPAPGAGESGGEDPSQDLPAASLPEAVPSGGRGDRDGSAEDPAADGDPSAKDADAATAIDDVRTAAVDGESSDPDGHATGGSEKGPDAPPASGPTELRAKASAAVAAVQKSGLLAVPAGEAAAVLAIDDREARTDFCYELIRWATDHLAGLDVTTGPRGIA